MHLESREMNCIGRKPIAFVSQRQSTRGAVWSCARAYYIASCMFKRTNKRVKSDEESKERRSKTKRTRVHMQKKNRRAKSGRTHRPQERERERVYWESERERDSAERRSTKCIIKAQRTFYLRWGSEGERESERGYIMAQRLFESRRRAACLRYRRSAASYANLPPYKYISLRGSLGAWPLIPGQEQGPIFFAHLPSLPPLFLSLSVVYVCVP